MKWRKVESITASWNCWKCRGRFKVTYTTFGCPTNNTNFCEWLCYDCMIKEGCIEELLELE